MIDKMFTEIKWITMETCNIKQKKDIIKILENNVDIKNGTNAFEIVFKDMNKPTLQRSNIHSMEILKFESDMVPLQIEKINGKVHITKKKSQKYDIIFVNVINEIGERFSALQNHIDPNDIILIINGNLKVNNEKLSIVSVQSETNTKLIHFKFKDSILDTLKPLYQNNLSKLSGSGVYSLFGNISKTLKYNDEDLMLLRIQCCDRSCIKTLKYPQNVTNFKDISKEEKILGVKSNFHSNQVDILVEKPSNDYLLLVLGQRIFLSNIKVDFSTDLNMFFLHLSGVKQNLVASPTRTGIIKYLVPVNKFASSTIISDKKINEKRAINMQCSTSTKKKKEISNCQTHNQIQNCVEVLQKSLSDEDILLKEKEYGPEKSNSPDLCDKNLVSLCSPPFVKQNDDDVKKKCIRDCRLIYIESDISSDQAENDFICGYCPKCFSFFPTSSFIKSREIHYCSTCEDVIHLTFFFKMVFLHGQNDGLAMEVWCYNGVAERVIKILTKEKINIENYPENQKFVTDTLKSFIKNKTRVNIIVEPIKNIHVLKDIDTKFIVP